MRLACNISYRQYAIELDGWDTLKMQILKIELMEEGCAAKSCSL
jgi:hypothetical protein